MTPDAPPSDLDARILGWLPGRPDRRRTTDVSAIASALGADPREVAAAVGRMHAAGRVLRRTREGRDAYYRGIPAPDPAPAAADQPPAEEQGALFG